VDQVSAIDLAGWRREVADLYRDVRRAASPREGWNLWRQRRAQLYLEHSQSPLPPASRRPELLPQYYEYDPAWRFAATVGDTPAAVIELPGSSDELFSATRFGVARFEVAGQDIALSLYWLSGYAGGLFASCRDATSGAETYGGGRYLFDTAKGADLGMEGDRLLLDFNFAYQPSCSYDPVWSCPLPPRENWLAMPIRAGERSLV
jgi:uncharacterized protein (DUF1684 family)